MVLLKARSREWIMNKFDKYSIITIITFLGISAITTQLYNYVEGYSFFMKFLGSIMVNLGLLLLVILAYVATVVPYIAARKEWIKKQKK